MSTEAETLAASDATPDSAQERLRLALAVDEVAVWELDPRDDRLSLVIGLARLYGLASDAALTRRQDLLAPVLAEDLARIEATIASVVPLPAGARVVRVEFRVRRTDGAVRWIRAAGEVRFDAAGTPVSVRGTARDVTDERRAADEHRRLLDIVEESPDIIMTASGGGEPMYLNAAGRRLLLGPRGEPERARESIRTLLSAARPALQDRRTWLGEHVLEDINGASREVSALAVTHPAGAAHDAEDGACVSLMLRDVSRLKEVERVLGAEHQHLALALGAARMGTFEFDPEHETSYWSAEAARILRLAGAVRSLTREDVLAAIDPDDRPQLQSLLEGHARAAEVRRRTDQGDLVWLEFYADAIRAPDDRVVQIVGVVRDATKRRVAEAALIDSEARFRSVIESMDEGVALQDRSGELRLWNPAAERILGVGAEQIASHTSAAPRWRILREDGSELAGADHPLPTTVRTGQALRGAVYCVRKPSGERVWLSVSATPLFRAGEATPHAGVATFTDITALRELVDRARESEGRLTAMIQFAMDAVISLDESHRITVFNAAAERIFGVPASEALGGTIDRFIPARYREQHRGHVDRFSASMSTTRSMASPPTLFGVRANGDEFPLEATISRVRVSGRVTMTVILRDVTEYRAIEAERRRSAARLHAIVDSANDAIVCFDSAGAVSVWNAEAERIFGWREAEALGRDVGELITSPETRGEFTAFLACLRDRRDGSPRLRNFETEGVDRTGRRIPLDITLSLAMIDGEALQSAIIRDDTHRREAQRVLFERSEELARVNVELGQALRVKDEFLATVSHELRTPLQAVIGLSMALNAGHYGEISHTQKGIVRAVATSGELLLQLINDLLDLTKVEADQLSLTPSETDIAQAVEECVEHVRGLAERKGLTLVHTVAPGIPLLSLDTLRFKQVLLNILGNAIKFTVAGAIDVRVLVEGASLVLRVSDTGIGIAATDLERIFRPFTQIDTGLRRQHAGTGLGLTLTRRLVELFHGSIDVESTPGAGSTFTVRLPLVPIKPVAVSAAPEREGPRKVRPLRILLCEDNEVNVLTLSAFLEALGHEVLVASDGQEAIERAVASQPDLVLMDVQMPVLDGIEAVRRLRADASTRRLRIVTLTAMGRSKDREQAAAVGADAFLTKPVTAEQLDRMISSLFSAEP